MTPEPTPSDGIAVGSVVFAFAELTIRTTAGLTLAATAMIADDSSILTCCGALAVWPAGTVAAPVGRLVERAGSPGASGTSRPRRGSPR